MIWYVVAVLIGVVCWELVKYFLRSLTRPKAKAEQPPENAVNTEDYPDLQVPTHPHIEFVLDSQRGLHCSNPESPLSFDNENCCGKFICVHPPTQDGAQDHPYARYFAGKKRIWETRWQIRFKRAPAEGEEFFFGLELEKYVPLGSGAKHAMTFIIAALRNAVGGLYHTVGDDPSCVKGELEKPACVFPLWAFDQFIYTPEGQEPPSLTDPDLHSLGSKRSGRVKQYAAEMEALARNFNTKGTYTLLFWGCSRFVDVINWEMISIPLVTPLDFDRFCGNPPVNIVLYSMKNESNGSSANNGGTVSPSTKEAKETRHLRTRKGYFFRISVWSSLRRPEKVLFESLTGVDMADTASFGGQGQDSLRCRVRGYLSNAFATCYTKPK